MFTLAFALIGSFAFANNSTINENNWNLVTEKFRSKELTKLIIPFMQMVVSSGTLNIIKFVKIGQIFLIHWWLCVRWIVEYDGMYIHLYSFF
jgi:hypothetical protein